jgi:predicted SAM-dependent methyltransferase
MIETADLHAPRRPPRLHLGCGLITPDDWINLDGSWNARLAQHRTLQRLVRASGLLPQRSYEVSWSKNLVCHDVRKPLPFPSNDFTAVYASHLLEHLYRDEAERLLLECRRVLRPAGILRMVVPDLQSIVMKYAESAKEFEAESRPMDDRPADVVNERLLLRDRCSPTGSLQYRIYSQVLDFHSHKWMYDAQSLVGSFLDAGFVEVSERGFRESRIDGIGDVEMAGRVLNGAGICVEGVNPL